MTRYNREIEEKMRLHFSNLNEKDKRHYAAIEAEKLGHGGQKYISGLFQITTARIRRGIAELNEVKLLNEIPIGKERRKGGGRKKRGQRPRTNQSLIGFY